MFIIELGILGWEAVRGYGIPFERIEVCLVLKRRMRLLFSPQICEIYLCQVRNRFIQRKYAGGGVLEAVRWPCRRSGTGAFALGRRTSSSPSSSSSSISSGWVSKTPTTI